MGRHAQERQSVIRRALSPLEETAAKVAKIDFIQRATSKKRIRGINGFMLTSAFLMVSIVDPYSATLAIADTGRQGVAEEQDFEYYATQEITVDRGGYRVVSGKDAAAMFVELAVVPDEGTVKAYAYKASAKRGWGMDQYSCLVKLWERESNWRTTAQNKSSGAYGIPQALPGIKMASAGSDWLTNPETQINWGLGYIAGRYKSPCGALAHSNKYNWY